MIRIVVLFFCVASIFSNAALAEGAMNSITLQETSLKTLKQGKNDTVTRIIDPLTIELKEHGLVRLTGLDVPDADPYNQGPLAQSAFEILGDMLIDQNVRIYQTKKKNEGQKNRMGHHLFHIFMVDSDSWIQGTLVRLGLARVRTDKSSAYLADELYTLEAQAREEKLGLWAFEDYQVLTPDTAEEHLDSFQIVEGTVISAARKKSTLYLNFGKDWRKDFTVSIKTADLKTFSKSGVSPQNFNGKKIRVRGWLRDYNGPHMDIDHAERFEVIE